MTDELPGGPGGPSPLLRSEIIGALRDGGVPRRGLEHFATGMDRYVKVIDKELTSVAAGQANFKAVRGEYGTGKTFFASWLMHRAMEMGYAATLVQISERDTPLHRLETVYRRAIEGLQTRDRRGAFRAIVEDWFYALEEEVLEQGVNAADRAAVADAVGKLLEQRLAPVSATQPQFGAALRRCHEARVKEEHAIGEGLIAWLMGQPNVGAEITRAAKLSGRLDHDGASGFFRGLLELLHQTGRKGLVLVLDEVETIQRVRRDSRESSLNALRRLIDEIAEDGYPRMYLLITGTPQFFDGPQGVQRAPALAQRLHTVFGKNPKFDSVQATQIRLMPFDLERLVEVGIRVRDLHPSEAPDRIREQVTDSVIASLAKDVAGKLGAKVGIAPRIFLKRLVGMLDQVDEHPDFVVATDYELHIDDGELTAEERSAAGRPIDADDIELLPVEGESDSKDDDESLSEL